MAALLLSSGGAVAQAPTRVFGVGGGSCANWTTGRASQLDAQGWILGYWTGLNKSNEQNHLVGQTTDAAGIIGEVRRSCQSQPTQNLFRVVSDVYAKMMSDNR